MKNIIRLAVCTLAFGGMFHACYKDKLSEIRPTLPTPIDTTKVMSYKNDIVPILTDCYGCHITGNSTGTTLDTYADVYKSAVTANTLLPALRHDVSLASSKYMPQGGGKISDAKITAITNWITQGAKDN